jgi:hypothetical protein
MSVLRFQTKRTNHAFQHWFTLSTRRTPRRALSLCLAVAAALAVIADGQDAQAWQTGTSGKPKPAAGSSSAETTANVERPGQPSTPNGDTVIVLNKDGKPVEVPRGPTWEEFLEFVRKRGLSAADDLPDSYIARLSLSGNVSIEDGIASLDVEVLVRVLVEDHTVDVPLRLTEATLRGHSYSGAGTLAFIPTERNSGVACRLQGKGEHVIRLKTLVAVRKSGDTLRLQLSLPASPQSELTLTVPRERIVVRGDGAAGRLVSSTEKDGTTQIRAFGLGSSLDLSWQELSARAEVRPEIAVTTFASATLEPEGADLEAEQTIVATRGDFDRLTIEIPAGFTLRSLTCPSHPEIQYEQPEFPRVTLHFAGPTTGPVKLVWSLYSVTSSNTDGVEPAAAPVDTAAVAFELQGFRVEEASRHEGFLRVGVPEGFHLNAQPSQTSGQQRQLLPARLSSFQPEAIGRRPPGTNGQTLVWRILDPGFRAAFQLQRIEPGFLVTPNYALQVNDRMVELTASFDVRVYRGSLQKLGLLWPDFHAQQWRVEVAGSPVDIELGVPEPGGDRLEMLLTEARSRTHDSWSIELTCRAPVPESASTFPLTLPQIDTPIERLRSPVVRVINERNIESTFAAARGTIAHDITDDSDDPSLQHLPANLRPRVWEIDSQSIQFDATVKAHEQEVVCAPFATLRFDDDRFEIVQRLNYSVSYEPLSRVRVEIPSELAGEAISRAEFRLVRPGDEESQELSLVGTGLQLGEAVERSLQLPDSTWGRFTVICEYSVSIADLLATPDASVSNVPLIQSADADPETTRVEIQAPANIELQLPKETWEPELSVGRFPTWLAQGIQRNLKVTSRSATGRTSERFVVQAAELQTVLFPTGSRTRAAYQFEGDVSWLTLTFPSDCNLPSVTAWWDGEPVSENEIRQLSDSTHALRFDLDVDDNAQRHLLEIEYQSQSQNEFGPLTSLTVKAPEFASGVQLSEAVWEITLPEDQYVFVYPESWIPQMRWQRNGLVWRRKPAGREHLTNWPSHETPPSASRPPLFRVGSGLTTPYRFSAFGHHRPLKIQAMSRPAIVLTGTGLALVVGLVLLRIPGTRHVLTLLVLTFVVSVLGLWHLESLQLLAQPAMFGLLLAVIGTLIDARARQRLKSSYVAYSSPSDFVVPGSSVVEIMQEETKNSPRRTPDATGV